MATTERRKSISLFFGFSKQGPKTDAMPDNFPKLRRKLQKVTKLSDTDMNTTTANGTITAAPSPDVGGVQTVKLPGDETFLATKYDASRPPPSRGNSSRPAAQTVAKPAPAKEEKQVRRESRTRSFFRSASTSRVPNTTRSSSSTRAATATPTTAMGSAIRPGSSRGEPANPAVATAVTSTIPIAPSKTISAERPSTATSTSSGRNNFMLHGNTSRQSSYGTVVIDAESRAAAELQALGDAQDAARAQKKAAQAAAQARAFQMMEEHERISAQQRSSQGHSHSHTQKSTPPSASRTKRMTMLPLTLGAQPAGGTEKPAARPYPMFHRPYSNSQHQNTTTPMEADVRRTLSTANKQQSQSQSPYTSRKSMHSAGLAPVTVPSIPMSISPLSPIMSSAMSDSSSTSMSSPTSAAFNLSSASLALTAATSVTQSYNNLPLSANGSASSCAGFSPDGSVVGSFPYTLSRRRNRSKYDFDNESSGSGSGSGSDGRRVVPELSYLSGGSSRGSPPTPDSPSSISSVEATTGAAKPRRKIKTPVYAIGQLESADDTTTTAVATEKVELSLLQSKSSIECIAEEYRALLASRNSQSTADSKSEINVDYAIQRPISGGGARSRNSLRRSVGANSLQVNAAAIGAQRKFMLASPGRDDSPLLPAAIFKEWIPRDIINSPAPPPPLPPLRTRSSLMGVNPINNSSSFHETANANSSIYEKLKAQTPVPPPPPPQPTQTDNLSLQICVDLLTRELSSAVLHRSSPAAATAASQRAATRRQLQQNGTGSVYSPSTTSPLASSAPAADNTSSALQILVMIEAYERLRDQLVADVQKKSGSKRNNKNDETKEIEAMFGLWLKSLYRIHDQLTSEEKDGGDDDYDDDNDELDNTSDSDYDSAAESV